MTTKEKSKALSAWCENQPHCSVCPLRGRGTCYTYRSPEERDIVEKNYEMIFGQEKDSVEKTTESVDHPAHYQGKNECIDVMVAMFGKEAVKHFCMCNAYKYRYRAAMKNGEEDIAKAEWYESKLIELGGVDES